nr:phosphotransferase [Cohnella mopanensis]
MASLHKAVHEKTVDDLPKQREILNYQIQHAPLLTIEEKDQILNLLSNLKDDNKLCHGDFHPDNIIIGEREWIIDWMTGMSGNPAGDVARTILLIQHGSTPEKTPRIVLSIFSRVRRQILKHYIREYTRDSVIDRKEIDQWIIPIAAARLTEWIPEEEKRKLVELIRETIIVPNQS